ncbi:hypothetical protein [Micromonospora sp. KLBMP9576]|uniref:hypothetical protein n=1 Tax=Micromonospora sp. KLBMP9576 TaxID=3424769 RepID=UPI003D8EF7D5
MESGVHDADRGGRHAAPGGQPRFAPGGEPRFAPGRSASDAARRDTGTTSGRRWVDETHWREAPAGVPESEHTGEWTFGSPHQDRGYAGRRRAEDAPVPEVATPRPPSEHPRGTWWGPGVAGDPGPAPRWEATRPAREERQAAQDVPAVDPWEPRSPPRGTPPTDPPVVDAWDASGVQAWLPTGEADRWGRADAGSWGRTDDTGPWDRSHGTGPWGRGDGPGRWERNSHDDGWDRTSPPGSDGGVQGWSWPERGDQNEGFWSDTRLAGDDPRWMDPPSAADAARRAAPGRRVATPAGASTAAVRDRPGRGASARRIGDDLLDPDPGGSWRPLLYTLGCYLVPAVLVFIWLFTLDGQVPAGCVTDVSGGGCPSPRTRALGSLASGLPRFGWALAGSLVVALLLRRAGTWRAASIALAASVVGGGLSTVLISAVTGQPIG